MQDATRMREQMDERIIRAETQAGVAEEHRKIAIDRRNLAEQELSKFKFLQEIFTLGEQVLNQRKGQFAQAEEPPPQPVLNGLEEALKNMTGLQTQAREAIIRHEGAFQAFSAFEETLKQEAIAATSRARGAPVSGEKAVAVAETRAVSQPAPQEAMSSTEAPAARPDVPGFLDSLDQAAEPEDSAKEPMGTPREKAP